MDDYSPLAKAECASGIGGLSNYSRTPRQRLQDKKDVLEKELDAVNAAISALDANPSVELVMTLVQRAL